MELEEGQHEARMRPDRLEKELRKQVQLMEELLFISSQCAAVRYMIGDRTCVDSYA